MKKWLWAIVAAVAFVASPAAAQYTVVASCPGTTAIYAPGQVGRVPVVDVNGNVCSNGSVVAPGGVSATVSLDGAMSVNTPANPQFTDLFSTTLDTTTNWTTNNSGGTTATSAGALVISGTTTASQYGGLSTKQSWAPAGISPQIFGVYASFNTLAVTNSVRIFGVYTSPGTPTLAAPITDGRVFRLDATGALFAEVWAAGAAIASQNITAVTGCTPTAGVSIAYYFSYRTGLTQFGCGSNPSAFITTSNPANEVLPISAYSIAGLSNPGSATTMTITGLSLSSQSGASVKAAGQTPTINDPATVVTQSPNTASVAPVVGGSAISGLVLKNAPGALASVYANCTAACWLMVFNAIAVPSNGATTAGIASGNMQECVPIAAGGIGSINYAGASYSAFSVGISAAISSTACATLTLATTGMIHGVVQ